VNHARLKEKIIREVRAVNRRNWGLRGRLYPAQLLQHLYRRGDHFSWHMDTRYFRLSDKNVATDVVFIALLMLSTSRDFSGGEMEVRDVTGTIHNLKMKPGELLIFPASYLHRLKKVKSGTRRVLVLFVRGTPLDHQERAKA
jgi:PKHD-type hydroxylase